MELKKEELINLSHIAQLVSSPGQLWTMLSLKGTLTKIIITEESLME